MLCPGTAQAFVFSSESKPLFDGATEPLIDLDASTGDLRQPAKPSVRLRHGDDLTLSLHSVNTDERLTMRFNDQDGIFVAENPARLNHFLRDWRQNIIKPVDPTIISGLARLVANAMRQGWQGEIQITSGYRTRQTNDLLRRRGARAARNSLHIKAKAIDFALPGISASDLGVFARETLTGGVGTYANFVHIDSGPARSWTG